MIRQAVFHGLVALLLCSLAAAAPLGAAERSSQRGAYTVYYNAMPSTRLLPEVASRYSLQRSRVWGVLTVSVLHEGEPVHADVRAQALDPRDTLQTIRMSERADATGIYSLGTFRMENGERMRFELHIRPDGHDEQFTVAFSERMFSD